jgi:hypothetical protein
MFTVFKPLRAMWNDVLLPLANGWRAPIVTDKLKAAVVLLEPDVCSNSSL